MERLHYCPSCGELGLVLNEQGDQWHCECCEEKFKSIYCTICQTPIPKPYVYKTLASKGKSREYLYRYRCNKCIILYGILRPSSQYAEREKEKTGNDMISMNAFLTRLSLPFIWLAIVILLYVILLPV